MDAAARKIDQGIVIRCAWIVAAVVLAYANTFFASFHYDDFGFILGNPGVLNFDPVYLFKHFPSRFLPFLSFAVNHAIHGDWVFGYHVVNIAMHALASLAVFGLVWQAMQFKDVFHRGFSQSEKVPVAFVAAMIFALHPIQTMAVTYIFQRTASMCAMFYLAALYFYLRSLHFGFASGGQGASWRNFVFAFSCALAAMFCKQNAVTLPLAIFLLQVFFVGGNKGQFPGMARRLFAFLLLTAVVPVLTFLLQDYEMGLNARSDLFFLPPFEYFLTQLHVLVHYLRLAFFPVGLRFDYDFPLVTRADVLTVALGIFLLGLLLSSVWFFRRNRLVSFGIVFFFLTHAIESSFFPIVDVINEYRMYLPMAGVALAVAAVLVLEWKVPKIFYLTIFLALWVATVSRNRVYASEESLWMDVVQKVPTKARAHNNLGVVYFKAGQKEKAEESFRRTLSLRPADAFAHFNLGLLAYEKKDYVTALTHYQKSLQAAPTDAQTHYNLAGVFLQLGQRSAAIHHFKIAEELGLPVRGELKTSLGF